VIIFGFKFGGPWLKMANKKLVIIIAATMRRGRWRRPTSPVR